ncbi:MAG: replicative DNA helicase [Selenomonas sp.]|uniref:replicative DNA helicase n=2 Tax=Selenomonas sp. AE3005 TaxID=1485543 RepID=UPI000483863D|nr:replicative DNA helicase [Selenomonas sp. AE3005]MBQ1461540.1 replicative DNA helicase [Selenomonas sp.]MBQ1615005.1 replicative DNA helicase [Selenomonas sp.]MBQ5419720.1 replicative DNA helicase [Selenomonas sp.]MBQ5502606.1 replicative DNA helicase [Selenomonas sp.]
MALPERVPPQNIEAEQAVLGAMLIKKEAIIEVQEILRPDDFYREIHRIVYEAMVRLQNNDEAVDLVTLTEELRKTDMLDKVGGLGFITQLANIVGTAANVSYHAKIVKEKAELRNLINVATEIAGKAYEDSDEVENIMDEAEKKILAVASRQGGGAFESMKNIVMRTFERINILYESKGGLTGISSGFKDLDKLTAGLQKSDLILVAARPSMGKTAFTLNIASYVGLHGGSVAFFSLEMSKEQLMQRMLCSEGGIDASRLRTGQLDEVEWNKLVGVADKMSRAPIYIDDTAGITVMELRSKARRLKAEHGLDLIIIDYLQLMQGRASKNSDNRQQEISEISRSLKALARELDVPVIALSQLSRSVESRQIKKPMLSDLRESGSLEQDADIVMFLYREDYYDKDTENKNITEIIVAKHRNGPVDSVQLFFQKEYTKFRDLLMQ